MPYLELSNLRKAYGAHVAIKDLSLSIDEGEAVAFLGSSGCGKTTTLRMIAGLTGLDSGQISLKKAQETMGKEIFWQIPNDYRTMVEVRNNGVPLITQAPRAKLTKSIEQLAQAVAPQPVLQS